MEGNRKRGACFCLLFATGNNIFPRPDNIPYAAAAAAASPPTNVPCPRLLSIQSRARAMSHYQRTANMFDRLIHLLMLEKYNTKVLSISFVRNLTETRGGGPQSAFD